MTELRLYDNALYPGYCRKKNRGRAVPNWDFQPDYIHVALWSQDDYENYDHLWRDHVPVEDQVLVPWDVIMERARFDYLHGRPSSYFQYNYRADRDGIRGSALKLTIQRQIQKLFTPEREEFGIIDEIHIRKRHKEDTQQQIINAIKEICKRQNWHDIVIPTHAMDCEIASKDLIRKQYQDIKTIIDGDNAADISELFDQYDNRGIPTFDSVPWGCLHFVSPLDALVQIKDNDNLLLNNGLTEDTFHLSVAEAIDKSFSLVAHPTENLGSTNIHVATIRNASSIPTILTFSDGSKQELFAQTEIHDSDPDFQLGEEKHIYLEELPVTISTDWKSLTITEDESTV